MYWSCEEQKSGHKVVLVANLEKTDLWLLFASIANVCFISDILNFTLEISSHS